MSGRTVAAFVVAVGLAGWAGACEAAPDGAATTAEGLRIRDAVVSEPVTGARSALFLRLHNGGNLADALLGLDVDGVERATLHRTETADGVMAMRPTDSLPIAPGADAELRPGGFHGMLEGIAGTWAPGDTVRVRLRFRRAGEVEVPAVVVPYEELDSRFPRNGGGRP